LGNVHEFSNDARRYQPMISLKMKLTGSHFAGREMGELDATFPGKTSR